MKAMLVLMYLLKVIGKSTFEILPVYIKRSFSGRPTNKNDSQEMTDFVIRMLFSKTAI